MALAVIIGLYVSIGILSAVGLIHLSQRFLPIRHESVLFGLLLVPIAVFYLAFAAYFGEHAAFGLERSAVLVFAALGCIGTRVPAVLIAGYALHGGWDLLHEIHAHGGAQVFGGREATRIPLAYGAFCASLDWAMAGYFSVRMSRWRSARAARSAGSS